MSLPFVTSGTQIEGTKTRTSIVLETRRERDDMSPDRGWSKVVLKRQVDNGKCEKWIRMSPNVVRDSIGEFVRMLIASGREAECQHFFAELNLYGNDSLCGCV